MYLSYGVKMLQSYLECDKNELVNRGLAETKDDVLLLTEDGCFELCECFMTENVVEMYRPDERY